MTLDPRITFTRASIGTFYNVSGVLSTAATNVPRFDYDPVTHVAKGLLIEEARTNNALNSQAFSAASWVSSNLAIAVDQTTAPDGTLTADRATAVTTSCNISQTFNLTTGTIYTQSLYAKKGTGDWIWLAAHDGATSRQAYFNLAAGTLGTVTVDAVLLSAAMQDVGNGWYRCSVTRVGTSAATNELFMFGPSDANGSTTVTSGKTFFVWGAQLESQAWPSSYVPTTTVGVLRAADIATMTGTNFSSWYNASAGTFVADFDLLAASGTRGIVSADNAATTERIWLYGSGTDPKVAVTDGGTAHADIDVGTIAAGTVYKLGISYALNDIAGCLNGGTVGTDATATMPTPTQLRIGADATPNYLNGHLRRIRFYNVAKSDAELQALTT